MVRDPKVAYNPPQMPGMDRPVLILSDHVAMKVRLRDAMAPCARVECVDTEHALLQRIQRPVRLIVIHGVPPFSESTPTPSVWMPWSRRGVSTAIVAG